MSGRRSLIKGYFWRCAGRGCGRVFGLLLRRIGSAGPDVVRRSVAPIRAARLTAQTLPRASGSIRFPAHHLLVTLDSFAARLLLSQAANPTDARYAGISR